MEKEILKNLIDHKKISILSILYFSKKELYLREIAEKTKVPLSSVSRILKELVALGLFQVRELKVIKFFSLVRSKKTKFLDLLFKEENLMDEFIRLIRTVKGVKKVLLHGPIKNNQGNIIILGTNIDTLVVDNICNEIKDKGLDLSNVVLTENQYLKLDKMGVYGGDKRVLLG